MADNWYCEVLHAEFGPLTWDDLRGMAARGTLRPKDRVRRERGGWRVAGEVEDLFPEPSAADSTDFEVGTSSSPSASDDDFDFDVSPQ